MGYTQHGGPAYHVPDDQVFCVFCGTPMAKVRESDTGKKWECWTCCHSIETHAEYGAGIEIVAIGHDTPDEEPGDDT